MWCKTNRRAVLRKLIGFTVAMVFLPLVTFFTLQWLFGNPTASGAMAAVAANAVLVSYIVVAFKEDGVLDEKKDE